MVTSVIEQLCGTRQTESHLLNALASVESRRYIDPASFTLRTPEVAQTPEQGQAAAGHTISFFLGQGAMILNCR
jgi:hypothetical protein